MPGNDAVQTLVNRIISYEAMGDAPLVSFPDTGTLQGREARAAAISEVQHAALSQAVFDIGGVRGIEDRAGAVDVEISTMSEYGRRPLTGREMAGVLTPELFASEAFQDAVAAGAIAGDTLSPEGTRQILEQFRAYLMTHPEDDIKENELPPGINRVPEAALREFVESSTVVTPANNADNAGNVNSVANNAANNVDTANNTNNVDAADNNSVDAADLADPDAPAHDEQEVRTAANGEQYTLDRNGKMLGLQEATMEDVYAALAERSEQYGGAPHYADGVPRLTTDARRTFWGTSYETMYTYCQNKANDPKTWFPNFWKNLTDFYRPQNVTNMESGGALTAYEERYTFLESVGRLQNYQNDIQAAYARGDEAGDDMLTTLTRLTPHTRANGGGRIIATSLREYESTFLRAFAEARAENRLDEFFDHALDGACFPARSRAMNDFADEGALRRLDAARVEAQERARLAAVEELLQLEGAVGQKEEELNTAMANAQSLTAAADAPDAPPEARAAAEAAQTEADRLKDETNALRANFAERQNTLAADAAAAAALEAARQRQLDRMTPVSEIIEAAHQTWSSLQMANDLNAPPVSWLDLRAHLMAEGRSEREFGNFDIMENKSKPGFVKMTEEWLDANAYEYFKGVLDYNFFDGPDHAQPPA
ncbi:MAG: hypothetical protein LBD82_07745 [Deltaproteobacteria bacterium]|jgi:hypothetical protein|nr:hypothetical protein [Deltaproteobacteria bacterium]